MNGDQEKKADAEKHRDADEIGGHEDGQRSALGPKGSDECARDDLGGAAGIKYSAQHGAQSQNHGHARHDVADACADRSQNLGRRQSRPQTETQADNQQGHKGIQLIANDENEEEN